MLVLLSPDLDMQNERKTLIKCFENGLDHYHLRKPYYVKREFVNYIKEIPSEYRRRVVVHSQHQLCEEYDLQGIHYQAQKRKEDKTTVRGEIRKWRYHGKTVSTSFHSIAETMNNNDDYHYTFLSPVFDSISKKNHNGHGFKVVGLKKKIIALGGINKDTLYNTKQLGYQGVGILGGVWKAADPFSAFQDLKRLSEHLFY